MADLIASLFGSVLPRLGQEPAGDGGVRAWLKSGTYQANPLSSGKLVRLENISNSELIRYVAADYERFALASWESFCIATLEIKLRKLPSWPLIKLYYSAFFAAHAIMRCTGQGIVKLEREQADTLDSVVAITSGASCGLRAGMYLYQISQNNAGQVELSLQPHSDSGGVHEGFWRAFSSFLETSAATAAQKNLPDAAAFIAGADEVGQIIKHRSSQGVWYSSVRNEINYEHKYGVWLPIRRSKLLISGLESVRYTASSSVRLDASKLKSPMLAFVGISQYLSCLNYELAEFIGARSNKSNAFGSTWKRIKLIL